MPETVDKSERLDAVIAEYLKTVEAGGNPDPELWIENHPDLAERLREFLADRRKLEKLLAAPRTEDYLPAEASASRTIPLNSAGEDRPIPGTRIKYVGDYEIVEELGRGGMGVVYRARQTRLDREVALKMILAGQFSSAKDLARFHAEAESAARLEHPNIVPIFEVGQHNDNHYFSMKLIEGQSLWHWFREHRPQPSASKQDELLFFRRAVVVLEQVAAAVHFAHERGIIHRDLKPGNILIDRGDVPHLTDFGLAKREDKDSSLTQSGAIVGTPAYMAPEALRGGSQATTRWDVYSLGVILYEVLTGRTPFQGADVLETLQRLRDEQALSPQKLNPNVPRELELICLKCLNKSADDRYPSAQAFADDLAHWLAGRAVSVRPLSIFATVFSLERHNPSKWVVLTLALTCFAISLLAGAVTVWVTPTLYINASEVYDSFGSLPRPLPLRFDWTQNRLLLFSFLVTGVVVVMAPNLVAIFKLGKRDSMLADLARVFGIWGIVSPAMVISFGEVMQAITLAVGIVISLPDLRLLADRSAYPDQPATVADKISQQYPDLAGLSLKERADKLWVKIVADQVVGMSMGTLVLGYVLATLHYWFLSSFWLGHRWRVRAWRAGKPSSIRHTVPIMIAGAVVLVALMAGAAWLTQKVTEQRVEWLPANIVLWSCVFFAAPVLVAIDKLTAPKAGAAEA